MNVYDIALLNALPTLVLLRCVCPYRSKDDMNPAFQGPHGWTKLDRRTGPQKVMVCYSKMVSPLNNETTWGVLLILS